jgi:hypothetical protein
LDGKVADFSFCVDQLGNFVADRGLGWQGDDQLFGRFELGGARKKREVNFDAIF